jgi:hypothetical protein
VTPADSILFASSILVASLIGYLAADLLCPVAYPRWLVWAFAQLFFSSDGQ